MKRILQEYSFSAEQCEEIDRLAEDCGLCVETVQILYGRGIRDKKSIYDFMHPSRSHFVSPFKMSGMSEAVKLITRARDEEWSVVVYGDYDADGICASTILRKALKDFGIEPFVCVPERRNGYGLSRDLIDNIFDECFPQLIITVDCGISCADEVEYIKELGAEVIVTDHHELPERIPDCICVNPKFQDDYIYDNLCGAGVAFKLACALNGETAFKYLDFAAIATVADSVPLTGENRDIVYEGLKLINAKPSECYARFLGKTDGGVTSQTLAFSIAPKINAAGRMGDANAALALFAETDELKIIALSEKLTEYNLLRQKYCDELYMSAKTKLNESGEIGKVIMLCNEGWNAGFVGIVAARPADEYTRPVILFVEHDGVLRGSARSVEHVNIFLALKACEKYITEFGGHSQAAGVNITKDNFENLREALDNFIACNYKKDDFIPTIYINGELKKTLSARFVKELELLEPYGVGNRRPMFLVEENAVESRPIKALSPHLTVKSQKIELMFFGGSKFEKIISSSANKKFIFEYNVSVFRGKEYIKGFIRDFICSRDSLINAVDEVVLNALNVLSFPEADCTVTDVSKDYIEKEMETCGDFGTLFIAWNGKTVSEYKNADRFDLDMFAPSTKICASSVLLSPFVDVDLNGYKKVIFLDNPVGIRLSSLAGKKIEICKDMRSGLFDKLSADRNKLLEIFAAVSANEPFLEGASVFEVVADNTLGFDKLQFAFALKVFEQLDLIKFDDYKFKVCRGVKNALTNSEIYNVVSRAETE